MKPYPRHPVYKPKEGLIDPKANPSAFLVEDECREKIMEVIAQLQDRMRKIITLRHGLAGNEQHSLKEVGEILKISQERVRQLEIQAMRSLRSSPLREKLLPFGIEPGSAEILEKLEVSVGFQGFPMGLEREFNALLSKGENFHFLGPYEDFGIMECDLEHLRELPLATDAGTICQMRLGGLSHDTAISLDTASWKNSYKPLIFDLSPEKNLKSNDVWQRERQRKGGRIFQSLLCIFVRRYFSRFLAKILSGENEWREFVLGLLNTARFAGTSAHHYSLWHANDPHFLTFKKELSDFGFEASVSDKGPNGRELKFRYRAADART